MLTDVMPPHRDLGPVWSFFLKVLSVAIVPTLSTVIVWGRDLEKRVNAHDVVLSTLQLNVLSIKESTEAIKKDIAETTKSIRELQTSVAVLVVQKENK